MKMTELVDHIMKSGDYDKFECEVHGTYLIRKDLVNKTCPYKEYHKEENKRCQEK